MRAVEERRRWFRKVSLRGVGVGDEDRIWAGQVAGMTGRSDALRLPASTEGLTPMTNALGEPVFVFGVSLFGGDDPMP